jgi:hypothetical protein
MMNDKIQETKAKGKKSLVIPKITSNGNFFISSPAFKFGLPVFDGPSNEELQAYKIESQYNEKIKELERKLEEAERGESYQKMEKEIAQSENKRLRNTLSRVRGEKATCEEKLVQKDQIPIQGNRKTLEDISKRLPAAERDGATADKPANSDDAD